ncbi:MAG: HEAT repeat domain-containing protein [Deltaproteobacteria bacterium]|nr:HEAT repeat domain-containing protein [Deltaproteobacteria bacterium]
MLRLLTTAIVLVLGLGFAAPARAQMTGNVDRLKADLHGVDLDRAVAAASALGSLKDARARDALLGGLTLGAPPKLLTALIEALGLEGDAKALNLLRHYTEHRNVKVRAAALGAVDRLKAKSVPLILIHALGDSHPMIRAKAARLLGERKELRAQRTLFKLLRKGDKSAAEPLGKVGGVEAAKQLAEMIGEIDNRAIARALGAMLQRKDFGPDPLRLQVVKTLCKLPGVAATAALTEYVASQQTVTISKRIAERCIGDRQK